MKKSHSIQWVRVLTDKTAVAGKVIFSAVERLPQSVATSEQHDFSTMLKQPPPQQQQINKLKTS